MLFFIASNLFIVHFSKRNNQQMVADSPLKIITKQNGALLMNLLIYGK
jgi:hypothetical protein